MAQLERVLRVPLPVPLIQELDQLVADGVGGYNSRAEIVRDAVEAMALELRHGVSADEGSGSVEVGPGSLGLSSRHQASESYESFGAIAFPTLEASALVSTGEAQVHDSVVFGLHNRDYPTLWAASRLATMTRTGPVPFNEFSRKIAEEAWEMGRELAELPVQSEQKLSAMFPTNREKPESSERAFLTFAIGGWRVDGTKLLATGPLFMWQVGQLVRSDSDVLIGLTPDGYELLKELEGLTVVTPHSPEHTDRFFDYLRRHAPADWSCFSELLDMLAAGIGRQELVTTFHERHPEWTRTVANTNAAGYVARAREWGLLAPRLAEGKYVVSDLGKSWIGAREESES